MLICNPEPDFVTMQIRLPVIRITKKFEFEMSHALSNYNGSCSNIHGHSYKLAITVSGVPVSDPDDNLSGMVIDFFRLKAIVQEEIIAHLDHALALKVGDEKRFPGIEKSTRVIYFPFAPTCEMLLAHICRSVAVKLPVTVQLQTARLEETSTSYAEWHREDNL